MQGTVGVPCISIDMLPTPAINNRGSAHRGKPELCSDGLEAHVGFRLESPNLANVILCNFGKVMFLALPSLVWRRAVCKMRPPVAVNNVTNRAAALVESSHQFRNPDSLRVKVSYFSHLIFRKNRIPALLALCCSPGFLRVLHIVGLSSKYEMKRVHASAIVAKVTNAKPCRNRPIVNEPRELISRCANSWHAKTCVPITANESSPEPTRPQFRAVFRNRPVLVNFWPEAFFGRFRFWSHSHSFSTEKAQPLQMENRQTIGRIQSNWAKFLSSPFPSPSCLFSQAVPVS